MDKSFISKKQAVTAILLYYGGIVLIAAGVIAVLYLEMPSVESRLLVMLPGLIVIYFGAFLRKKCGCPCGESLNYPRPSLFSSRGLITIGNIRKGLYKCPACNKEIEIK